MNDPERCLLIVRDLSHDLLVNTLGKVVRYLSVSKQRQGKLTRYEYDLTFPPCVRDQGVLSVRRNEVVVTEKTTT